MIEIKDKTQCCGCSACYSICPKKCIAMKEDSEGFKYPYVDKANCIECNLCVKVCPIINHKIPASVDNTYTVYAAKNKNQDELNKSASGSIFPLIAKEVLNRKGVVFGARWNDKWEVVHSCTDNIEGLSAFQNSKYVQSDLTDTFASVKKFLTEDRYVLFSGTPCQILGLKSYLGKKANAKLLTVDIACHSVASPSVWRRYLKAITQDRYGDITNILFRKKGVLNGKAITSFFLIESKEKPIVCRPLYNDAFGMAFGNRLISRPSCGKCIAENLSSQSDITLGDFWGIERYSPDLSAKDGLSVVICKSLLGREIVESIAKQCSTFQKRNIAEIFLNGGFQWRNRPPIKNRDKFFDELKSSEGPTELLNLISKYNHKPFCVRLFNFVRIRIKRIFKLL